MNNNYKMHIFIDINKVLINFKYDKINKLTINNFIYL